VYGRVLLLFFAVLQLFAKSGRIFVSLVLTAAVFSCLTFVRTILTERDKVCIEVPAASEAIGIVGVAHAVIDGCLRNGQPLRTPGDSKKTVGSYPIFGPIHPMQLVRQERVATVALPGSQEEAVPILQAAKIAFPFPNSWRRVDSSRRCLRKWIAPSEFRGTG